MVMRVWQQSIVFYCKNEQEGTMKSVAISRYNAAHSPTRRKNIYGELPHKALYIYNIHIGIYIVRTMLIWNDG